MATPQQQQQILQMYAQQNPEFAGAPPELQQGLIQAITSSNPKDVMQQLQSLHEQYPQFIKMEGILHNPAFWVAVAGVGGAIAAPAIASALGGGTAAAPGAGVGIGETEAVAGITPQLAGTLGEGAVVGSGIEGADGILGGIKGIAGKVSPYLDKLGPVLGNMAKAGAEANANRDRILPSMEAAQLARDKYALEAPSTRMSQSVKASILKNAQPSNVNWAGPGSGARGQVPTFTGGFTGALANLDPETRQLADTVLHKDLQDQLAGKDDSTRWLDQFGHESAMDKIIGGASTGVNIWDALRHPKVPVMS